MKKYLITGGCGFIGSHLVHRLIDEGNQVVVIDNLSTGSKKKLHPLAQFIQADASDRTVLNQLLPSVDGCIHLAAVASVSLCDSNWSQAHKNNYACLFEIVDCINTLKLDVGVIYASSAAVYGDLHTNLPLTESMRPKPVSIYGVDKLACENLANAVRMTHSIALIGLRFFNVFGNGQNISSDYSGVITLFMEKIKNNKELTIFGDGEQTRDFIYVADVVDSIMLAMSRIKQVQGVFNICSGESVSINQLAQVIMNAYDQQVNVNHTQAKNFEIQHSTGCGMKAQQLLHFKTKYTLATGLQAMLDEQHEGRV